MIVLSAVFDPVWSVSLLPPSSTRWEKAVEAAASELVARDPVRLVALARSGSQSPMPWLPYLAAERSVDEFSSAWPEVRQRQTVESSFPTHQVMGTRAVFDRAFHSLGYRVSVVEWFEATPRRRPNTFRIALSIDVDREWKGGRPEIIRVANRSKNAHTKLEAIEVRRAPQPGVAFVGGYPIRSRTLRVGQVPKASTVRLSVFCFVGAGLLRRRTLRIGARS